MEPAYPGAKETVVNLFGTLDPQRLYQNRAEIIRLFDTCGQLQKSAGRCLASASLLLREQQLAAAGCLNREKLEQYVTRLGRRLLPDKGRTGSEQLRLLSAITPQGPLCYTGTVETLASHKVVFRDEGAAAPWLSSCCGRWRWSGATISTPVCVPSPSLPPPSTC